MTLAENDAQLKKEGRFEAVEALRRDNEQAHLRHLAEINEAAVPIVEALRANGLNIQSIGE